MSNWQGITPEDTDPEPDDTERHEPDDDRDDTVFGRVDRMLSLSAEVPQAPEPEPDKPGTAMLDRKPRPKNARKYEDNINRILGAFVRRFIVRPATVPDAAALLMHGPKLAERGGNVAAGNETLQRLLQWGSDAADNDAAAFAASFTALALQLARNHEPVIAPRPRVLRVPLLRREFKLPKVGVRLGLFREWANEPTELVTYVLSDPDVIAALAKHGIRMRDE